MPSRLTNQVKDVVRKELCRFLQSWSLQVWKRVVWSIKRLVRVRRQHGNVEVEEDSFVDQFVEANAEPIEQLDVVVEGILNIVDAGIQICFHDQLVESGIEIVEHLVLDDLVAISGALYVVDHLVVSNDIVGVVSLACIDGDLHIIANVEFVVASVDSLVVDLDEGLLLKHYVQFVLGCEHVDQIFEILVFDSMMQIWMICRLVFLSLLEWKPLVKIKMVVDLSLGIKVWDTLSYLPREFDVGDSWIFLVTTLEFLGGGLVVALEGAWTGTQLKKDWCLTCSRSSTWSMDLNMVWELNMVYGTRHGLWSQFRSTLQQKPLRKI